LKFAILFLGETMFVRKKSVGTLDFSAIFAIAAIHALAVFAPWYFSWSGVTICVFLIWLSGWIGITLCYHRLLTHGSFKTPQWFRYLLTIAGTLAWQGGPVTWVGNHRLHHLHPDTDDDPHSPLHGFSWSHMFWTFRHSPEGKDPQMVTRDLLRDKGIAFINRLYWIPQFLLSLMLFFSGLFYKNTETGFSWVAWGIGVRTVIVYHVTWFVNSVGHTWGYRNFHTNDRSKNHWLVAVLSAGEGWHNNHHAQQRSAAHGIRWFEIDLTYRTIKLLSRIGLAWDIVEPVKNERIAFEKDGA
jgi:stearoyl-CoA desaturase (delta-9 desaturase)